MRTGLLTLLLLGCPFLLHAQSYTVTAGLKADAALKIPLLGAQHTAGLGVAGDAAVLVTIRGTEERSLGFTGSLGITTDRTRYYMSEGNYFTSSVLYIHISGLISFPMTNRHLALLAGIDLWAYGSSSMSVLNSSRSGSGGTYNFAMDLDSNYNLVNKVQRKLIPGISAGLQYTPVLGKSISIYAMVTQPLLSRLEEEVPLLYRLNGTAQTLVFNEHPTYLRLGLMFRFGH
jgi:hypothetical protein